MAFRFLTGISDPAAYKLTLRVLNGEGATLTDEEWETVLKQYKNYLFQVTDDTVCRALLLIDTVNDPAELSASPAVKLLGENDLAALGQLAALSAEETEDAEDADKALSYSDSVVKIALCRTILDRLTMKNALNDRKEDVLKLCDFLKNCADAALYDGSVLAMGVRSKWK